MQVTPPFDRVEVVIRGYNGENVIAYNQIWTQTEFTALHPQYVSQYVAAKVSEITQAMSAEALKGE